MNSKLFGEFDFIPDTLPSQGEVMILLQPIDLVTFWKRCGLLANFGAAFYSYVNKAISQNENLISTVFNELIENAAKFSKKREAQIVMKIKLFNTTLKLTVQNTINRSTYLNFSTLIQELLESTDLESLYFQKLESKTENDTSSGLGLLMLLKDYPIKMGVKFDEIDSDTYTVTTNVYCFMEEEA